MGECNHLLAAVLADPAADGPRLVLADWLEERSGPGDAERADLIRCQCSLAEHGGRGPKGTLAYRVYERIRERERALLLANAAGWLRGLPGTSHVVRKDPDARRWECRDAEQGAWLYVFRRGFVAEAHTSLADWLAHGPALVRAQPLERVEVTDRRPNGNSHTNPFADDAWMWWLDTTPYAAAAPEHALPAAVFDRLPDSTGHYGFQERYPTEAAARAALSAACLAWARADGPAGGGGR